MPAEEKARGAFAVAEYKKQGDRFVGTYRSARVGYCYGQMRRCSYGPWPSDLTLVSPTRIEGRSQAYRDGAKFDCRKCAYDRREKLVWHEFVWIPE